ncbi:hypothetical protein vseg_001954 [Gypsophila vaccaria]
MVNAASGGAIINKTIEEAHTLIEELSKSSRNFLTKPRKVHMIRETSSSHDSELEEQMASLTNLVKGLMQHKEGSKAHLCMVCDSQMHTSMECPHMMEEDMESVNAVKAFGNRPLRKDYDPNSNTYNPGWKDHLSLRSGIQDEPPKAKWRPPQENQIY